MSRVPLFVALLLIAACGGGGTAPAVIDLESPHTSTELLLMMENPEDDKEADDIREKAEGLSIERLGDSSFYILRFPDGTDLEKALDDLGDDARVVDSQPNYLGQAPEGGPSDAPVFGDDVFATIPLQPALGTLHLAVAHTITEGAGITVAVVDTGVDFSHPFLAGHLSNDGYDFIGRDSSPSEERNFLDDDGDTLIDEQFGHGTFVASLVLAVAPGASILPIRVLNDDGIGTVASVAAGIYWGANHGARVINISVDIRTSAPAVEAAITYARDHGALVIAAAGNEGMNSLIFPARYGGVVAVTALNSAGVIAPFANRDSKVSLSAPGVSLLGAVPFSLNPAGTARWSGTSFAAPLAAGSAALVFAAFPALSADAARQQLEETAMPVNALNPGLAGKIGKGRVDPGAAVAAN